MSALSAPSSPRKQPDVRFLECTRCGIWAADDPEVRCEYTIKYPSVLEYPVSTRQCLTTRTLRSGAPDCRALPANAPQNTAARTRSSFSNLLNVREYPFLSTLIVYPFLSSHF